MPSENMSLSRLHLELLCVSGAAEHTLEGAGKRVEGVEGKLTHKVQIGLRHFGYPVAPRWTRN